MGLPVSSDGRARPPSRSRACCSKRAPPSYVTRVDRLLLRRTDMNISRRKLMQTAGMAALASPASAAGVMPAPRFEGRDTPKIALSVGDGGAGGQIGRA